MLTDAARQELATNFSRASWFASQSEGSPRWQDPHPAHYHYLQYCLLEQSFVVSPQHDFPLFCVRVSHIRIMRLSQDT